MRVKIFNRMFTDELEKDINTFLIENTNKKIIDIKYTANNTALIIYDEEDKQ
ncbi:MAG: sporulation protein Cse60 [Clostridia bacterium]|jgi:hypothetical protein|nr:sporulation protein Cse60 [Clostridia bacterium]